MNVEYHLTIKRNKNINACDNMDEFQGHWLSERNQIQRTKDCILFDSPMVTESRLVVAGAWVGAQQSRGHKEAFKVGELLHIVTVVVISYHYQSLSNCTVKEDEFFCM